MRRILLLGLAVALACVFVTPSSAETFPPPGSTVISIRLAYTPQVTADVTDAAVKEKFLGRNGRIVAVLGRARAIGGGTPFTDVAVEVLKNDAAVLAANLPVVATSALTAGGTVGTPSATAANLLVTENDVLRIKLIDVTGGASTPTLDGLEIVVWIALTP